MDNLLRRQRRVCIRVEIAPVSIPSKKTYFCALLCHCSILYHQYPESTRGCPRTQGFPHKLFPHETETTHTIPEQLDTDGIQETTDNSICADSIPGGKDAGVDGFDEKGRRRMCDVLENGAGKGRKERLWKEEYVIMHIY